MNDECIYVLSWTQESEEEFFDIDEDQVIGYYSNLEIAYAVLKKIVAAKNNVEWYDDDRIRSLRRWKDVMGGCTYQFKIYDKYNAWRDITIIKEPLDCYEISLFDD